MNSICFSEADCTIKFFGLIGSLVLPEKVGENSHIKINKMFLNLFVIEDLYEKILNYFLDQSFKRSGPIKLSTNHFP